MNCRSGVGRQKGLFLTSFGQKGRLCVRTDITTNTATMQPRHDKLPQRLTDDSEEEGDGQENFCETYGDGQRVVLAVRDDSEVADIYSYASSHHSPRQPSWWVVRLLAVLSLVLLINIALLLVTRRPFSATSSSSSSSSASGSAQQQQARISERLNNATIPNWKPLPDSSQILTRIAFGSCLSQEMPQPVWDTLLAQQQVDDTGPDLVLLMGDNVYGDCDHDDCFLLRQAYRTWANHPSLQGAASQLAVYATLDDHDYGMADCTAANPHKEVARQLFAEFFNLANLPVDGVYRTTAWGPPGQRLQVILLDTRYSRSAFVATSDPVSPYRPFNETIDGDQQPQQQMLSERQWTWLEQQLNEPADLRLVVSSVQVLNQVTGFEAWRHLPQEQTRLVRLLQNKRAVLLSGDRHVGGFYEFDGLIEVTSSSMTHAIPLQSEFCNGTVPADCDEVDAARVGDFVRQNHYGMVDIDWDQQMVRLSLRRTESSYGAPYSAEVQELYSAHQHGKFSDAGQILASREYSFVDL